MSTVPPAFLMRPAALVLVVKAIDRRAKGEIQDLFGEEPSASGMQTGGQDDLLPRGGHGFPAGSPAKTATLSLPPASLSLFTEPSAPAVQPSANAGVSPDAGGNGSGETRRGAGRFRGLPKMKEAVHALSPMGLGGLFDDTVHPRAGTGATTVNPETGKIISGGQFAPNPLAASHRFRDKKKRGQDAGEAENSLFREEESSDNGHAESNDSTDAGHSGKGGNGTAGTDALGAGVPAKSGARRFRAVRNTPADGAAPIGGLFGAGSGEGHGSDPDTTGNGSGAGPENGVGAVHTDAESDGGDGHEPVISEPELTPAAPVLGTSMGVGYNAPQKTGSDYRISDEDGVGKGGDRAKFEANLAALRVLNDLQPIVNGERMGKGREATPEEQAILVKYSGWGWGGQKAFNPYAEPLWRGLQSELRPLLTDGEYNEARASTDNAHYTAPAVIRSLWDAARHLGFSGGRILEPAAGIGHFCGLMPSDIWANSRMGMIEIDPLSAAITSHLYQSAKTMAMGFQEAPLPIMGGKCRVSDRPW